MKLTCIGDSLTSGYGVSKNDCWVELVKIKLGIDVVNKGINGDSTSGMLSRSYEDVVETNPSHVIIMGGCNDFIGGRFLKAVEENIEELIKEANFYSIIPIIGIQPSIDKVLAEKMWSFDVNYDKVNQSLSEYREHILNFSLKNNVAYIDFYNYFIETLKCKNSKELYIDGLHPTPLGHQLMAQCVIKVLSKS